MEQLPSINSGPTLNNNNSSSSCRSSSSRSSSSRSSRSSSSRSSTSSSSRCSSRRNALLSCQVSFFLRAELQNKPFGRLSLQYKQMALKKPRGKNKEIHF
ncbi:hypothetical protein Emag_001577 [Eimeria magna]